MGNAPDADSLPTMKKKPFVTLRPSSASPLVLTCEHASNRLPREAPTTASSRRWLASHWGWDPGAWELTVALCDRLGCGAFGGVWSRLWVDLNRSSDDPELARAIAGQYDVPWNLELSDGERQNRIVAVHDAYHDAIDRHLQQCRGAGETPWLISVHTYTEHYPGSYRSFESGVLFDRWEEDAVQLAGLLKPDIEMRFNEPWSGREGMMYSAERHGSRHGLRCLELEWNQTVLARPGAVERITDRLAPALQSMLASRM